MLFPASELAVSRQFLGAGAPVYLEYLAAEILELAGNAVRENQTRIISRYLQVAICSDRELNKLLGRVIIAQGCVLANFQALLLLQKTQLRRMRTSKVLSNQKT
nr:histone H2A.J-like [Aotus nancymaae]